MANSTANAPKCVPLKHTDLAATNITPKKSAEADNSVPDRLWRPLALRHTVFVAFAVAFAILLVAIEILYSASQSQHGVASTDESKHYLWTYGPTGVLTIFAMFWARLEYRAKAMAPYHELARGPSPASKTILADYLSPLLPVAIFKSFYNRHFLVTLAMGGTLLLKLLIVLSTGMLSLSLEEMVQTGVNLRLLDSFGETLQPTGDLLVSVMQGSTYYDLPLPWGTTEEFAFPRFDAEDDTESPILSTDVDAFHAWLDCEPANLTVNEWYFRSCYGFGNCAGAPPPMVSQNATIASKTCYVETNLKNAWLLGAPPPNAWLNGSFTLGQLVQPSGQKQAFSNFFHIQCKGQDGPDSRRIFWQVTEVFNGPMYDKSPLNASLQEGFNATSNVNVLRTNQAFCKPRYAIDNVHVTVNISTKVDPQVSINQGSQQRQLAHVSPFDIADTLFSLSIPPYTAIAQLPTIQMYNSNDMPPFILDHQSALAFPPRYALNPDALFQNGTIDAIFHHFYARFAAQIAASALLSPAQSTIQGQVVLLKQRLCARIGAVRAMEVLSAVLVVVAILMSILLPGKCGLAFDPCSISGVAAVLNSSFKLREMLQGLGARPLDDISRQTLSSSFHSVASKFSGHPHLAVEVSSMEASGEALRRSPPSRPRSISWWRPFFSNTIIQISISIILFCLVAVMETLAQLSRNNHGLVDLPNDSSIHYSWTLIPAALMVTIGILCRSIDQITKIFAPFAALGSVSAGNTALVINFLTQSSWLALFTSVRKCYYAVACTTFAVMLTAFLTIIVSGLFYPAAVPLTTPIQLRPLTWFNATYDIALSQTLPSEGAIRSALILLANMSYPAATYETLAFPTLETVDSTYTSLTHTSTIEVRIPAVRAVLTCNSFHSSSLLNASIIQVFPNDPNLFDVQAWMPQPPSCKIPLVSGALAVHVPEAPQKAFGHAESDSIEYIGNYAPCPRFNFFWGSANKSRVDHISALSCFEHLESVSVDAIFNYPSFTLNLDTPPRLIAGTETYFSNTSLATPYTSLLRILATIRPQPENADPEPIDAFFADLVDSRYGIPETFLTDPVYDDEVITGIRFQHGVIRAQQFASWIRIPSNSSGARDFGKQVFNGTITDPTRQRLYVGPVSARVLEAVLCVIAICILVSGFIHENMRRSLRICSKEEAEGILPHNPCSIAGTAALLADSTHLDDIACLVRDRDKEKTSAKDIDERNWKLGWFDLANNVPEEQPLGPPSPVSPPPLPPRPGVLNGDQSRVRTEPPRPPPTSTSVLKSRERLFFIDMVPSQNTSDQSHPKGTPASNKSPNIRSAESTTRPDEQPKQRGRTR